DLLAAFAFAHEGNGRQPVIGRSFRDLGIGGLFQRFFGLLRIHDEYGSFGGLAFADFIFFLVQLVALFLVASTAEDVGFVGNMNGAIFLNLFRKFRDGLAGRLVHGSAAGRA